MGRTILWGWPSGCPPRVAGPLLGWLLMRRWERRAAKLPVQPEAETTLFSGAPAETVPETIRASPTVRPPATTPPP